VLTEILPETEKWGIDAIPALVDAEKAFGWKPDALLRLAAIVPPDRERLKALAERLRLSKAEAAILDYWAAAPEIAPKLAETAFERLLYRNGPVGLILRLKLALSSARAKGLGDAEALSFAGLCQRLLAKAEKWQKPSFPLTGADVLAAGVAAGPKVGAVLGAIEDEWVAGNFNEGRAKLLARLEVLAKEG
jgi:poly(A) polymerase